MTIAREYLPREEYDKHLENVKEAYTRLDGVERDMGRLNAEVLGDETTGRPSLRQELSTKLAKIYNLGWVLFTSIVLKWVSDWYFFRIK